MRYALYVQDYGGPVGFRLASAHPERVTDLIVQNAVAHEEGISGPLWDARKKFWADRPRYEDKVRANLISVDAARLRHVGSAPHGERYDPDLWTDEAAFLARPGEDKLQLDLFYDYRTNVLAYPAWQAWLKKYQPHTLILWGKYDPSFSIAEVDAFRRDLPAAEVHILDAGHFALDEAPVLVSNLMRIFLDPEAPLVGGSRCTCLGRRGDLVGYVPEGTMAHVDEHHINSRGGTHEAIDRGIDIDR
jgi:pimeloyl-ACP methyl ester carboxylesterase